MVATLDSTRSGVEEEVAFVALSLAWWGIRTRRAQVVASTMSCQRRLVEGQQRFQESDVYA
jgi:hypothetical protein